MDAVLYFRYADSPWLAAESRRLTVPHTQTAEEAIVRALIGGPSSPPPYLSRLIPRGTEVLSVQENAGLLFVTLSGAFLDPLPGEPQSGAGDGGAALRRRLMTSSLANALTQSGRYHSVQVLVMREGAANASMRLSARVWLEDSDRLLPPLTRSEDDVLTPGRALQHILSFWQARDFADMRPFVAAPADPAASVSALDPAAMPALLDYEVSAGIPSPDGSHAVVTLRISGMDMQGREKELDAFPVRLERQDSVWKISPDSLLALAAGLGGAP
ncbi:MAG TPA: GerMN domain-containing protein [Candidatus Limnocylindria bacterium]|nr:GerMN domain-containing protein [Candidatus Limnocylindria bacterium]